MPITISAYDHTATRFASGANSSSDAYKVKLLTAATFNAAHTTLVATGGTETAAINGYTAGGVALTGVSVTTVTTNDAKFSANNIALAAVGGPITAAFGILYNDTDLDDPPVAFIDFDGSKTATAGLAFNIAWNAAGIFTFTVA